jgi:hypothetical protein
MILLNSEKQCIYKMYMYRGRRRTSAVEEEEEGDGGGGIFGCNYD